MTNTAAQPIFLGTFVGNANAGTVLQLEIYFHANGYAQYDAATAANLLSPSKMTVMLEARLNVLLIVAIQQLNEKVEKLAAKIELVKKRRLLLYYT